jgi:hypothetical protein
MTDGTPVFATRRIVAVRQERLAMAHHEIVLPDQTSTAFLILNQLDAGCDLAERIVQFDADDAAIAVMEESAASRADQDGSVERTRSRRPR